MRRQSGFTLLETTIAVAIFTAVAIAALSRANSIGIQGDLKIAESEARIIAAQAELFRNSVLTSTAPPTITQPWTYTFNEFPNFVNANQLATAMGVDLPTQTPWGTPYRVRADDRVAIVRYVIPASENPQRLAAPSGGTITILGNGNGQIELMAIKNALSGVNARNLDLRRRGFGEDIRS